MNIDYDDILSRVHEDPLWWDENAVPRFVEFHPKDCGVYIDAVALVRIACQDCAREFKVAVSTQRNSTLSIGCMFSTALQRVEALLNADVNDLAQLREAAALQVADIPQARYPTATDIGSYHFGDPPYHEDCAAGPTMNCENLEVLQFWVRDEDLAWKRLPEHEVTLVESAR